MRSYNRFEKEICTEKRKNLSLIQRRKERSVRAHSEVDEEGIYSAI